MIARLLATLPFRRSGRVAMTLFAAAPLVTLVACAESRDRIPPGVPDPDKFLFQRGTAELEDRKWLLAREDFRQIVDNYPQSPYRADAKLGLGDSYLGEGTNEAQVLAISEFREFLTFFPTHPRADYAQFRLAMAHYYQMRGPERDQTQTKEALKEFDTFFERYPNSGLKDEVRVKWREVKDRLSQADYRVGLFYYRAKWYPGAIDRFKITLKNDPQYTNRDAVYFYLAEALVKSHRKAEALPYYELIVKEFEVSDYLPEARKRIAELKGDNSPTPSQGAADADVLAALDSFE
ncbi:MAG: outer membrane protein assembly factor BamD [Acidobacteria bacterium]|nr:outer membrane protein assembly factor BamD [Acidobacteriota bacterium]